MWMKSCTKLYAYCTKLCQLAYVVSIPTIRTGRASQRNFVLKTKKKKQKLNKIKNITPAGMQNGLGLNSKCGYCILCDFLSPNGECMGA